MAPLTRLVSLKVLDTLTDPDHPRTTSSALMAALSYVREVNGWGRALQIHGLNLSLGCDWHPVDYAAGQSPLCREVNLVVSTGVVVVISAGNAPPAADVRGPGSSITEPAHAERAITVGATHRDSPHSFGVWYRSAKGPTLDGRRKPDLVAPGEKITSAASGRLRDRIPATVWSDAPAQPATPRVAMGGATGVEQPSPAAPQPSPSASEGLTQEAPEEVGGEAEDAGGTPIACYAEDSGTSMAAPHVSGAVAAFLSVRQEYIGQPDLVKELFCAHAISLGRDPAFEGHGLVDLMAVLSSV